MTNTPANPDTWSWRDLPVLREAARGVDAEPILGIRLGEVAEATGLNNADVYRASKALQAAGLVELREYAGDGSDNSFEGVSGAARVLVGQWPTEETALDRMIAALEEIAANTDDSDTRTNAQKFAAWLRTGATTVGLSVATAAITGRLPGHGI
jgi:hypothetical protein